MSRASRAASSARSHEPREPRAPREPGLPLWARAFLAVDAVATRLENVRASVRDELFLALVPAPERVRVTAALYAKQRTYLPGGHRYEQGLFPWEERVFDGPHFPRAGRVLVGAAGAGREARGLAARGFDVVAFDPCEPFVDAARASRVSGEPAGRVAFVRAAYDDLEPAARGEGPLAASLRGGFDAVVLGWGSLSHVAPREARAKLFADVRAIAPKAVVLASFALHPDAPPVPARRARDPRAPGDPDAAAGEREGATDAHRSKGRVRDALRRVFTALGAPGASAAGDHFYPDAGFLTLLFPDEVLKLAWQAGYEVVLFEEGPYPHVLLASLTEGGHSPDRPDRRDTRG